MIADATGSCRLVLWADCVGILKEGQSYHLKSLAVRQYKNQQYMSVLERTTDFEKISDIGPVDERHVASERNIVSEITSVLSFELYLSCPECKSKVQQVDSICGRCTKCHGVVKLSKCPSNMLAKVKLEDDEGKCHFATMFTMIESDEGNVPTKLLQSSQMFFTISNRDIITQVSKELSSQVQSSQEMMLLLLPWAWKTIRRRHGERTPLWNAVAYLDLQ